MPIFARAIVVKVALQLELSIKLGKRRNLNTAAKKNGIGNSGRTNGKVRDGKWDATIMPHTKGASLESFLLELRGSERIPNRNGLRVPTLPKPMVQGVELTPAKIAHHVREKIICLN